MCSHQSCGAEKRVWLPVSSRSTGEPAPHPWCVKCGTIKNLSESRGRKMGYWMNVLSRIAARYDVSQAQKRLVAKALQAYEGFDDVYAITYEAQCEIFSEIMNRYCNLNESTVYSWC